MYEAITSANLAADAVLDVLAGRVADLTPYETAVAERIGPLTAAGWSAKRALDRFPRTVFTLTRLPVTWRAVEQLVLGETPHPTAARGAERMALKTIELVARVARTPVAA
jgi:flavin-dependent dehydrogenase